MTGTITSVENLRDALLAAGFHQSHATKKLLEMRHGDLTIYLKRETRKNSLVVEPKFQDLASKIEPLGVTFDRPLRFYVNSNMRRFPEHAPAHRKTTSRCGFALSPTVAAIPALVTLLEKR